MDNTLFDWHNNVGGIMHSLLYFFSSANENCKRRYGLGDCSNICLPTADGHICMCDAGRQNLQDRHTCVNGSVTYHVLFNLTLNAPMATKVVCFYSSAEMFKKPLRQTVWTKIRLLI